MSMRRITISLPEYLYEGLTEQIATGKVSRFVAQAVEKELIRQEEDPIDQFIKLREKLPKKKKKTILEAIQKGRK